MYFLLKFYLDWGTGIGDSLTTDKALGGVHSNGADGVLTQMLGDFENEAGLAAFDLKGIENWWATILELDIDNGTNNGDDLALGGDIGSQASRSAAEVTSQHLKPKIFNKKVP